jgi:hypothetical protein
VERFRAGLVFRVHRFLYHSTLGSRVIKEKKKKKKKKKREKKEQVRARVDAVPTPLFPRC